MRGVLANKNVLKDENISSDHQTEKTSQQVTHTGELRKESSRSAFPPHSSQPEVMGSTWGRFWAAEQPQDTAPWGAQEAGRRAVCRSEEAKPSLRTGEAGNKRCEETGT